MSFILLIFVPNMFKFSRSIFTFTCCMLYVYFPSSRHSFPKESICTVHIDSFGKECLEEGKYTYCYKREVDIPPLGMVDDVLCMSECGISTSIVNSYINYKTHTKKLQ